MPLVNSSAILRIEYEPRTLVLSIWFRESGGPYDYYDVAQQVYAALMAASSKGQYFNEEIRDRYAVRHGSRSRETGKPVRNE